jgi:uncharacterized protein (TIGR03435 family)
MPNTNYAFARFAQKAAKVTRSSPAFTTLLRSVLERPLPNKTGIAGRFYFRLEYAPDQSTPGWRFAAAEPDDHSGGPSIFTAIREQLGLKLESTKGPNDFLVIDRAKRSSEN